MVPGPLLVATGAALFACTNAASTAFYRHGGTVITVYLIRCIVVYIFNVAVVAISSGPDEALCVLLQQSGDRRSSAYAYIRGLLGSAQSAGLNIALVLMTFSDAFTVFVGFSSLFTVLIARWMLDQSERLAPAELAAGGATLIGVVLIAQPPLLFGVGAVPVSALALAIAALAGSLSAGFSVVTRVLSRSGSAHAAHMSPAMLLSHKLGVMLAFFVALWLIGLLTHASERSAFAWMRFRAPSHFVDWALLGAHCVFTLGAQLALAAGYATTRAGIGGFLQSSELAWVYLLDVSARARADARPCGRAHAAL